MSAFLDCVRDGAPEILDAFAPIGGAVGTAHEGGAAERVYGSSPCE